MTRNAGRASGFTLLELLIALVLVCVLLTGLWSLFATYEGLFSRGQAQVERAQLARSLLEQIASDLRSAIPDDGAVAAPGQTASLRRFGLFGSARALQVDVLQVAPQRLALTASDPAAPVEATAEGRVPELHTVQYLFEAPDAVTDAETGVLPGLVRRELDWETTRDRPAGLADRGPERRTSADTVGRGAATSDTPSPDDQAELHVPEIVGCEFRYYDGQGWAGQWNSLTQKSLPLAIEVTLTLAAAESTRRPPAAAEAGAERMLADGAPPAGLRPAARRETPGASLETPGAAGPSPEGRTSSQVPAKTVSHRLLVYLPSSALRRAAAAREASTVPGWPAARVAPPPQPPPLPVFRPGPPPPRPELPADTGGSASDSLRAVLQDQWMRSGS